MKKTYYILEIRKYINQHINKSLFNIGLFKTPKKCIKWIKKDNCSYINDLGPGHFFAVVSVKLNSDDIFYHSAYNKHGKEINPFKPGKLS